MDTNKTGEEPDRQNGERVLPRGLEHVSNLFISRSLPGRAPQENSQTAHAEPSRAKPADPPITVVLRSCGFSTSEQLASLLKKQAGALEEGMTAIDTNIPIEASGSIEILALDARNRLTIVDLDDHPNDELLLRGIDHYDWIVRNISNVRRMYAGQLIDFSLQPRIFLVAPEFSALFRSVTRHFTSLQIQCLKYRAVTISGGIGIFFEDAFRSTFQETRRQ